MEAVHTDHHSLTPRPRLVSTTLEYWTGYREKHRDGPNTSGFLSLEFEPDNGQCWPLFPVSTVSLLHCLQLVASLIPRELPNNNQSPPDSKGRTSHLSPERKVQANSGPTTPPRSPSPYPWRQTSGSRDISPGSPRLKAPPHAGLLPRPENIQPLVPPRSPRPSTSPISP